MEIPDHHCCIEIEVVSTRTILLSPKFILLNIYDFSWTVYMNYIKINEHNPRLNMKRNKYVHLQK